MKYRLNISKVYLVDKPYDEAFQQLQKIVEAPYNDSTYSLYGSYYLTDPAEFIFLSKPISFSQPGNMEVFSTKVIAKIYSSNDKTTIKIKTTTNATVFVLLTVVVMSLIFQIINYKKTGDYRIILGYLGIAVGILAVDRFVKSMLVANFEEASNI